MRYLKSQYLPFLDNQPQEKPRGDLQVSPFLC